MQIFFSSADLVILVRLVSVAVCVLFQYLLRLQAGVWGVHAGIVPAVPRHPHRRGELSSSASLQVRAESLCSFPLLINKLGLYILLQGAPCGVQAQQLVIEQTSLVVMGMLQSYRSCCMIHVLFRHVASFLSIFKLFLIGLIVVGKDPFTLFGMEPPRIWTWSQENKVAIDSLSLNISRNITCKCTIWKIVASVCVCVAVSVVIPQGAVFVCGLMSLRQKFSSEGVNSQWSFIQRLQSANISLLYTEALIDVTCWFRKFTS